MLAFIQPNEFTSLNIIEYLKEVSEHHLTLKQVTHTVIRVLKLHNQHHFSCTYVSVFHSYVLIINFSKNSISSLAVRRLRIEQIITSCRVNYTK